MSGGELSDWVGMRLADQAYMIEDALRFHGDDPEIQGPGDDGESVIIVVAVADGAGTAQLTIRDVSEAS